MILVRNVKLSLDTDLSDPKAAFCQRTGIALPSADTVTLYKKAIDARNKQKICFTCSFLIDSAHPSKVLAACRRLDAVPYTPPAYAYPTAKSTDNRPVVIGFGPAGMFCALILAKAGLRPIVLERGCAVEQRQKHVADFMNGGALHPQSNVQFGEGGAGTFSDGKLNTGIKDPRIRLVLETFVEHGADPAILYDAKPHIGTDVLVKVVRSIRSRIIALGGEVRFEHHVIDMQSKNGRICAVSAQTPNGTVEIPCSDVVLAPGHSARDTFAMLQENAVTMMPKPFAVGVRVEHSQVFINRAQYGAFADHPALSAADYRLAVHLNNGRGVFSFCMCPGGEVVNASSEHGGVVVNGMSNHARDGSNANSAILVGVEVDDFYRGDVLDGVRFQQEMEQKAYALGNGLPVAQTFGHLMGQTDNAIGSVQPSVKTGVTMGHIGEVLPDFVTQSLKEGMILFDRKIRGFAAPDTLLIAPETRSSSPVRILRDERGRSHLQGLYPCGEGAGYAGGITSAAVDGIKTAELLIQSLNQ